MTRPHRPEVDALRQTGPVEIRVKEAKSVLNRRKHVDAWLWDRYSVNAYEGCAQACEYCDATSNRYYKHVDFHRVVYAKVNAPAVLRRQLARRRPDVVAFSGVTEPYQPAERQHRLTRQCLEVLLEFGFPAHIITKSHLVTDDLDLLAQLHATAAARVSVTIPTVDDAVSRAIEPRSPSPQRRLDALAALAERGIVAGVTAMPLVPGLADRPEDIRAVVTAAKAHGAHYVLCAGMSMHDRQRERWLSFLDDRFPKLLPLYRAGAQPSTPALARVATEICAEVGVPDRMSRPISATDPLRANKRVAEALLLRCDRLRQDGEPKHRLWALRRAAWAVDDLDVDIQDIATAGSLTAIEGVGDGTAALIAEILASRSS